MLDKESAKQRIIDSFEENVKGKFPSQSELKSNHKGKIGHWLEARLGKNNHDSDGNADLWGWECKKDSDKISWGDWSAPYRIYCDRRYNFQESFIYENQWKFTRIFGVFRPEKNRFSWSGSHVPARSGDRTTLGMTLFLEENKDISIYYNFSLDTREDKNTLVPKNLQQDKLLLMKWHGTNESFKYFKSEVIENQYPIDVKWEGKQASVSLEERVRRKFDIHGMFKGLYSEEKGFYALAFTERIPFEQWISFFKKGDIIYDTGLTDGNRRPYNQWRSSKKFMEGLITDYYPST